MALTVRLNPLRAPVIRRVFGARMPEAYILQPQETEAVRPPAILPGMLDRVIGTDEHSVLADHLITARETIVTHAPVLRRTYRNALVRRSGFATWGYNESYDRHIRAGKSAGPILHVPEMRYCHNYVIWRYFGHWLTDAIPSALIDPGQGELWMPPHADWCHAKKYSDTLDLTIVEAPLVHADQLIVYQDFGQGSHKQARYAAIRSQLHEQFGSGEFSECVYIKRGTDGAQRFIVNERALIDELVARNWVILDVSTTTVEELQRVLCRARVVVSIDGSHLDHAHLSLQAGAVMVVLMPQDRFSTRQIGPIRAHRVSPGLVVLNGTQAQGYQADIEEILRTVDLAETLI